MDKTDIRRVLKNPSKELVDIALSYVNLTDKEQRIIRLCEIEEKTEEQAAEIMDISDRNLRYLKSNAFNKLNIVWSYNYIVSIMLKG